MCRICKIDNCDCMRSKVRKYETKKVIKTGANSIPSGPITVVQGTLILGDNSFHLEEDDQGNQIIFSNIELVEEEFDGSRFIVLSNQAEQILGVYLNGIRLDSDEYILTLNRNIEILTGNTAGLITVQYNKYIR